MFDKEDAAGVQLGQVVTSEHFLRHCCTRTMLGLLVWSCGKGEVVIDNKEAGHAESLAVDPIGGSGCDVGS